MTAYTVCIKAGTSEQHIQFSGFIVGKEGLIVSIAHELAAALHYSDRPVSLPWKTLQCGMILTYISLQIAFTSSSFFFICCNSPA